MPKLESELLFFYSLNSTRAVCILSTELLIGNGCCVEIFNDTNNAIQDAEFSLLTVGVTSSESVNASVSTSRIFNNYTSSFCSMKQQ